MTERGLVVAIGAMCCLCFVIGAKVGQQAGRGQDVRLPKINPVAGIREHKARKEAEQEQSRMDTIMRNIDNYDGTGLGQKDVPGR